MRKILIGILLGLSLGISFSLFAWVNPSQNPPSGGGVLQTSNTGLTINTSTYFISGNVGIGTTAPNQKLEVVGKALINGAVMVGGAQPGVGGDVAPMIDLGVGTTREVNAYKITRDVWATGLNIVGGPGAGGFDRRIHMWDNVDIKGNAFVAGNVGIGTTEPVSKLDVVGGNIRVDGDFIFWGSTNKWILHTPDDGRTTLYIAPWGGTNWNWSVQTQFANNGNVYFSGNVGIGTTAPRGKLDLTGTGDIWVKTIRFVSNDVGLGEDNSDPYLLEKVHEGPNVSHLALHLNDDANEEFRIYGYSCNGYGCGVRSGNLYHFFRSDGTAYHAGNVGIGTTAPLDKLDVRGRRALIHVSGTTYNIDGWGKYVVVGEIARENTWPTFLPAGSIGLEATWESDSLFVGLRDYGWDRKDAIINWGDNTNDNLRIQFSGEDRILITSAGNVGIGTTNPGGYRLYVNGSLYASSYYCASDIRLKRDIQELNGTLEKIMNLHPISFVWNEKSEKAGKKDIGISGQEIEKYFPELVFKNDDGYISVDYSKLSVVAISAIKEQQKIIEEQAQKIKILEEKIKELESKIEKR